MNEQITISAHDLKQLFISAGIPALDAYSIVRGIQDGHYEYIKMGFDKHIQRLFDAKDAVAAAARRQEEEALDEMQNLEKEVNAVFQDPAHPEKLDDLSDREELRQIYRQNKNHMDRMTMALNPTTTIAAERIERQLKESMGITDPYSSSRLEETVNAAMGIED